MKFKGRFDEFFKSAIKSFFEAIGFRVESEFEIFKLPKKLDVLVIKLEKIKTPIKLELLDYFSTHNLISYKSPKDNFSVNDFHNAIIYLHGYINMTKDVNYSNCTMTILCNQTPKKYLKENKEFVTSTKSGFWIINYGIFKIYLINLNLIEVITIDSAFLADFGDTEIFKKSISYFKKSKLPQKIMDILNYYIYLRVKNFEKEQFEDVKMPVAMEADITEFARPIYTKGKLEGKLEGRVEGRVETKREDAKKLKKENVDVKIISRVTGLSIKEIEKL